ncbi:hypothetical protein NDA14_004811 [Ustilago hordei]|nr:hypothetical protein NDA14_004811 [Ustilago hordei]
MEAYNKLLALRLTSDAPGATTHHVEQFRDLEGQVNLDDNKLVIDLFRGSLTRSIQEKFERNPPGKRWEWYREGIGHWARDCPSRRVDPLSSRPMGPKVMVTTTDPFEEATDSGDGHTGSTEMGDPEAMDLSPYQQSMDPDHEEEEHNDGNNEGNVSGIVNSASMQVSIGTHNLGVVKASVANTADYDLILGFTKLWRLKPTIQWDTGQLEFKTQEQD